MGFVKKTASIIFSLIIILAIGGYFFVRNFDLNKYKPYIEEIVFNSIGRRLNMSGDANIAISLIPTIEINNVSLSNPEWANKPNMVELKKLEVKFAVLPLLEKRIVINKLILHGAEIYLEKSSEGKNNWTFASNPNDKKSVVSYSSAPKVNNAGEVAVGMMFVAKNVKITDGVLNYFDAQTSQNHLLEIDNISADIDSFDEPLVVDALMKYNGEKIDVAAKISTINNILNNDKLDFEAKINALNVKADLIGAVDGVLNNPVYAVEGNIYNPDDNFSLPEIKLDTRIDGDMSSASASIKKLLLAENEITGKVAVNWSLSKPDVKLELIAGKFDVTKLIKNKKQAFKLPSIISSANALTFVPNDTVDFSYLNMLNAVWDLNVGDLVLPDNINLKNLTLLAKLQKGVLNANQFSADFGGGKVIGDAIIKANDNSVKINLKTNGMKLQEIDKSFADKNSSFSVNSGGEVMLDLSISSYGNTYRKMSENISGQMVVVMDKTSIRGANMSWLTNNVLGQLLSLLKIDTTKARNLDIACAVIRSDFKNGKAIFPSGIAFNSEQIKMVGSGDVNLVNDNINFTIAPTLNKLADGNITQALASFVKIEGTLNKPKLRLDTSSALSTIVGAVATGGMSLGGEVLLSGDSDPCHSALINTPYANKFVQTKGIRSDTKRAYQEVSKQTKNAVKGIGNAAKNLLGAIREQF